MFCTYTGTDLSSSFNTLPPFWQFNLVVLLSVSLPRGIYTGSSATETEESWRWLPGRIIEVIWSWLSDSRIKSRSPHWLSIQWDAVKNLGHTPNSMNPRGSIVKTSVPLNSVNWLRAVFRMPVCSGSWARWSQNPSTMVNFGITRAKLWSSANCRTPGMSQNSSDTWLILEPIEPKPWSCCEL